MTTLRLMSYNVRGLKDDRETLRKIITTHDPDVLCVQEVMRHPLSNSQVSKFAESVNMLWAGGNRHRMSTTLFTAPRLDVHDSGHGMFDIPRPQEPRGYGWARVSKPGLREVNVVSVHMSLYSALRGPAAQKILDDPRIGLESPLLIAGDFNELETGPAAKVLKQHLIDAGPRYNTSPSINPEKRIDFVYASLDTAVSVVPIQATDEELGRATDHRPLVVDVSVK